MGKMGAIPKPQESANNMATMQKVMQDPTSKASQAAISKLVNPQVLKQMGGVSGVTKAMQVGLLCACKLCIVDLSVRLMRMQSLSSTKAQNTSLSSGIDSCCCHCQKYCCLTRYYQYHD
jgi:hypothetical protein